jgi:hypothetical protein
MPNPRLAVHSPTGLSFELADLLLAQAWSEFHELRMTIELDYYAEGDEFEEVLEFYAPNSAFRRWMLWRAADGIVVQPIMGRPIHFITLADALEHLIPASA